jgi:hypothetical protein
VQRCAHWLGVDCVVLDVKSSRARALLDQLERVALIRVHEVALVRQVLQDLLLEPRTNSQEPRDQSVHRLPRRQIHNRLFIRIERLRVVLLHIIQVDRLPVVHGLALVLLAELRGRFRAQLRNLLESTINGAIARPTNTV